MDDPPLHSPPLPAPVAGRLTGDVAAPAPAQPVPLADATPAPATATAFVRQPDVQLIAPCPCDTHGKEWVIECTLCRVYALEARLIGIEEYHAYGALDTAELPLDLGGRSILRWNGDTLFANVGRIPNMLALWAALACFTTCHS